MELPQSQSSVPFRVWTAPTNSSLLSLCAQEVFGSFIASILDIVDDVGSIDIQETRDFRLESSFVSEIVKLFTERQLGSREDALLCVLPPMIPRLGLPSTESAVAAARRNANQHRRRDAWKQAEAVLRWALRICTEAQPSHAGADRPILAREHTERAAISLGELYRSALQGNDSTKEFGLDGIKWLSKQEPGRNPQLPVAVREIIDRYSDIAKGVDAHGN
ncbi:hypothetical protein EDB81DRAFT_667416, partial [Dactylonectria macrodidyma]